MEELEIPKYRKKAVKSNKKSNHKHLYAPCKLLIHTNWSWRKEPVTDYGTYCTICGKIGDRKWLMTEDVVVQWNEENPTAPTFELHDFMAKNVFEKNKKI